MVPVVCTTQIARAQGRLTQAFKNQPNIKALLAALLVGVPEIEALYWQIINTRILSNLATMVANSQNTADQLDIIGALVGVDRLGRTDAAYLPAIQLQIRVNRSKGRSEDILDIMSLTGLDFSYSEAADVAATFRVDAYGVTQPVSIANAIQHGRSGGTKAYFTFTDLARAPVVVAGNVTAAPIIWTDGNWADSIGGTDLTSWPSSLGA